MPGAKKVVNIKNQLCNVSQLCEGICPICFVFSHFFVRVSNGCQYSNFGNKCPKLVIGTPEDMVLTNLGETLNSDASGFVLIVCTYCRPTSLHTNQCFGEIFY